MSSNTTRQRPFPRRQELFPVWVLWAGYLTKAFDSKRGDIVVSIRSTRENFTFNVIYVSRKSQEDDMLDTSGTE